MNNIYFDRWCHETGKYDRIDTPEKVRVFFFPQFYKCRNCYVINVTLLLSPDLHWYIWRSYVLILPIGLK